ncbi:MAG: TolC family protein [Candidatus Eisenbacteria bacterium]
MAGRSRALWMAGAFLTFVSGAHAAPDTLSVADCVRLAREHAPTLAAARYAERAAAAESTATSLNRRPDVFLSAGALFAPEWSYDPAITNLGEYHLQTGLTWPLADGGHRTRERERAQIESASARDRRRLESRDAGERAAVLAYELLRLDDASEVLRNANTGLGRLVPLVRAGVRAGARSPADSMRLTLALANAELDLEDLRTERKAAAAELLELIGRGAGSEPVVRAAPADSDRAPTTADSIALLSGLARLPELALARAEEASARLDSAETRHRGAPVVTLTLDAGLLGSDLTRAVPASLLADDPDAVFADRLRRDLGASAAFDFRLPLLDRALAPSLAARTESMHAAAASSTAEGARQRREALDGLERWRTAAARVRATVDIVTGAEMHVLRLKSLYAAGATTLFELLDAVELDRFARLRLGEALETLRIERFRIEDRR